MSQSIEVSSSSLNNCWFVSGDNGSIGVGNEAIVSWSNSWDGWDSSISSMGNWGSGNSWSGIGSMSNNSLSTEMLSSCSSNSRLISWDNGSVWMRNEAVEWSCGGADRKTTNNDLRIRENY